MRCVIVGDRVIASGAGYETNRGPPLALFAIAQGRMTAKEQKQEPT